MSNPPAMATDLNELLYFVQVSEVQSLTAAAKRLGVPKSTISRGLRRLERRLGVCLLQRTTRRVALSQDGEVYLRHCRRILEEVESANNAVTALQIIPRGRLVVGAPLGFIHSFLGANLREFLLRYPELRVHLVLHGRNTSANVLEENLDVLIRFGAAEDSGLLIKHFGRGKRGVYASPTYLEEHGAPASPSELPSHVCITQGKSGPESTWRLHCGSSTEDVVLEPVVSVASSAVQLQLVLSGVGIALLPKPLACEPEREGRLVRILKDWEPEPVAVYALYPSRLSQALKVRVFLEWVDEHMTKRQQ